jgi:hypothetical protein
VKTSLSTLNVTWPGYKNIPLIETGFLEVDIILGVGGGREVGGVRKDELAMAFPL